MRIQAKCPELNLMSKQRLQACTRDQNGVALACSNCFVAQIYSIDLVHVDLPAVPMEGKS